MRPTCLVGHRIQQGNHRLGGLESTPVALCPVSGSCAKHRQPRVQWLLRVPHLSWVRWVYNRLGTMDNRGVSRVYRRFMKISHWFSVFLLFTTVRWLFLALYHHVETMRHPVLCDMLKDVERSLEAVPIRLPVSLPGTASPLGRSMSRVSKVRPVQRPVDGGPMKSCQGCSLWVRCA